jgi:hypothetical protein
VAALRSFMGYELAITILSNGIQDETRSGEIRLMDLARALADRSGVKVFVRQKPVAPPEPYRSFFHDAARGHPSIMLTHREFDLFDFLEVTDLFVTSNSSSVLDFCAAGRPFFAVKFWDWTDLFLWQTAVDGVYLSEQEALGNISEWCADPLKRAEHAERMKELSGLLAYKFGSFGEYKDNLRRAIEPWVPPDTVPDRPAYSSGMLSSPEAHH